MVFLSASPDLPAESLTLFHTTEPLLSDAPILVFRGPASSAAASTISSSRIQIHVFTAAGFQSYSRLAISPSSPLYSAVNRLSREDQGDEVCRELAYGVFKYFSELPQEARVAWIQSSLSAKNPGAAHNLFTDKHAAQLASRMQRVDDARPVIEDVKSALASKSIAYQDADVILPSGSITDADAQASDWSDDGGASRCGKYAELISLLGEPAFLPTSKMRRAPSRPTARNHSLKYTVAQKEALRREMCELVDTEESYVEKLQSLVGGIVSDTRMLARKKPHTTASSDAQNLRVLFPPSLDAVLQANTAFMQDVRKLFDETEAEAINDIEHKPQPNSIRPDGAKRDPIGVTTFAKCLLEHLPRFQDAYAAYIRAHENMGQTLKYMTQQPESDVSARLREIGEKKLTSLLIEPVQRLPRYNLYIENMTKQLPTQHPALKQLLAAKDVIAEICASDASLASQSRSASRLKSLCRGWPDRFDLKGRLISAIDGIELQPPYNISDQPRDSAAFIMLLFADIMVLLQKQPACGMTARSLTAEIENPAHRIPSGSTEENDASLVFFDSIPLTELRLTEMQSGQVIQLASRRPSQQRPIGSSLAHKSLRAFYLGGQYEGRAAKLTKEFVKARAEGRFTEQERESPKWQVRDLEGSENRLGLFTAIYEEGQTKQGPSNATPAMTRLVLDPEKHRSPHSPTMEGADTVASVTIAGNGFFRMEVDSVFSDKTKDFVTGSEFVTVLTKRLTTLAQMRGSLRNPLLTTYLLQHYDAILRAVRLPGERLSRSPSRTKSLRQHSPVKAIANLFGGSSKHSHEQPAPVPATNVFTTTSRPHLGPKARSESRLDTKPEPLGKSSSTATIVPNDVSNTDQGHLASLEAALETFVLALRARKGNIIGRVIANRSSADEATVNHVYNALLERPEDHEPTSQAPVDALFAAFEKFLKVAWRERLGPILDNRTMDELQIKAGMLTPIDYEEYLTKTIDDMVPQNRRALRGVIGLLIDLLDGTGNDGDRGALMATITEIMVCEGNPHDYMPLFDRLVEEHDVILSEAFHSSTPHYGSMATRTTNTGSFSSKASSLGKRLGFGSLGRKNSKSEAKATPVSQKSPRAFLARTGSVDWGKASSPLSRPGSKDRPPTSDESRPGTGKSWDQLEPLETIKAGAVLHKGSVPRKKRRSSLSDIEGLPSVNTSPFWNSPAPRRPDQSPLTNRGNGSPLRQETPSILSRPRPRLDVSNTPPQLPAPPSQSPFLGRAAQSGHATVTPNASPTRAGAVRHRSPTKKENEPHVIPGMELSPPSSNNNTLNRAQSSPTRHARASSTLAMRAPLSERPGSGNTPPPINDSSGRTLFDKDPTSPTKLRKPSPSPVKALQLKPRTQMSPTAQKLQPSTSTSATTTTELADRITDNAHAISSAESSLMAELAKIGQEFGAVSSTPNRMGSRREESLQQRLAGGGLGGGGGGTGTTPRKENIEGRLRALEQKVPHLFHGLAERTRALEEETARKDKRIAELETALGIR